MDGNRHQLRWSLMLEWSTSGLLLVSVGWLILANLSRFSVKFSHRLINRSGSSADSSRTDPADEQAPAARHGHDQSNATSHSEHRFPKSHLIRRRFFASSFR
jgi:hypothetical protein